MLAFAWDVQDPATLAKVRDFGCDGIFSDSLALLADCLTCSEAPGSQPPVEARASGSTWAAPASRSSRAAQVEVQPESHTSSTSRTTRSRTDSATEAGTSNAPTTLANLCALLCNSCCGRRSCVREQRSRRTPAALRKRRGQQSRTPIAGAGPRVGPPPPPGAVPGPVAQRADDTVQEIPGRLCVDRERRRQPAAPSEIRDPGQRASLVGRRTLRDPSGQGDAGRFHPGRPRLLDIQRDSVHELGPPCPPRRWTASIREAGAQGIGTPAAVLRFGVVQLLAQESQQAARSADVLRAWPPLRGRAPL